MVLEERISKHLGKPYVSLPEQKKFLCSNGVLFTLEEYKKGIDINAEYKRREKEDKLYDYAFAKSTGILREKRNTTKTEEGSKDIRQFQGKIQLRHKDNPDLPRNNTTEQNTDNEGKRLPENILTEREEDTISRRNYNRAFIKEAEREINSSRTVTFICLLLLFTSLISGYISTLHTATYLYDYVDVFSAWLMSASVTAYNATAFEVAVVFKTKKRYLLSLLFITLWGMVTLFSMATTVSVFYDRFNFTEAKIAEENKQFDSSKLAIQLLQKKEADLREAIAFKKKDIQYRQEHDYATTAVRNELSSLEAQLQENLSEQQNIMSDTPEATKETISHKESLFSFIGRLLHIEGGIMEFIMSTLSAIFVNLICPFSLIAVAELKKRNLTN